MIKHGFVSAVADGGDATLVRPSNWNDFHTSSYATGSFTLATGTYAVMSNSLILTGSQQAALQGTSQLRIT